MIKRQPVKRRILVAEDDRKTAELVKLYLERAGYAVLLAHDGGEALDTWRRHRPDLLVLDLMLPTVDGVDICRTVRAESSMPVIMLTARSTEDDKLYGLDIGADDYITKPFSPRELVARVRTVLRRTAEDVPVTAITMGDLTVDFLRHEVRLRGERVRLTPREFTLLAVLAAEPGRAFSRSTLLEKVFGYDYDGFERTLDVHIMNLRKKIEADPAHPTYVQTVYGLGYKLGVPVDMEKDR
jgi:DNA-binding response OmpR family regulator